MPVSLLTQNYPNDFQVVTIPNVSAIPHDPTLVLYADRDLVIDQIVVGVHAVGGTDALLTFESTTDIDNTAAAGTVLASVNVDTANVGAGNTIVTSTHGVTRRNDAGVLQSGATGTTVINSANNVIPAGSWLIIDSSGTMTGARVSVQVRFRSQLA